MNFRIEAFVVLFFLFSFSFSFWSNNCFKASAQNNELNLELGVESFFSSHFIHPFIHFNKGVVIEV